MRKSGQSSALNTYVDQGTTYIFAEEIWLEYRVVLHIALFRELISWDDQHFQIHEIEGWHEIFFMLNTVKSKIKLL